MDYGRPRLADRLAAEYVLGTLRGPARRRFETLLGAHPALRAAVRDWQARLEPMAESVAPVAPSPGVWSGIERTLFTARESRPPTAEPPVWWRRLGWWQGAAGVATAAAITLGVLVGQPPPAQPPIAIVMNASSDAGGLQAASFVASVAADGRSLVLKPLGAVPLAAGRALELWAVPGAGAPRSLGLVSPDAATTVLRARLLDGTAAFAVSVEPAGGSPTGAPTGPIVSVGKLQS
jgi:anti-sigma-K factor RskA